MLFMILDRWGKNSPAYIAPVWIPQRSASFLNKPNSTFLDHVKSRESLIKSWE